MRLFSPTAVVIASFVAGLSGSAFAQRAGSSPTPSMTVTSPPPQQTTPKLSVQPSNKRPDEPKYGAPIDTSKLPKQADPNLMEKAKKKGEAASNQGSAGQKQAKQEQAKSDAAKKKSQCQKQCAAEAKAAQEAAAKPCNPGDVGCAVGKYKPPLTGAAFSPKKLGSNPCVDKCMGQ